MGIRGGSVLAPGRPFQWIAAEVVFIPAAHSNMLVKLAPRLARPAALNVHVCAFGFATQVAEEPEPAYASKVSVFFRKIKGFTHFAHCIPTERI